MILPLWEILASVPDGRRIFVEFKCGGGPETLVDALPDATESPDKVVLISFDLDLMRGVKRLFPRDLAYLVAEQKQATGQWQPGTSQIVDKATRAGLDGVDLANTLAVDREAVKRIHDVGLACCLWTVNLKECADRLIEAGVDSLTMDDPRLLLAEDEGESGM